MSACPRCGRVADDEFVCAGCGLLLAGVQRDDAPGAEVSLGRLAALVVIICLLAAGTAFVLLHQGGGGGGHEPEVAAPLVTDSSQVPQPSGAGWTPGGTGGSGTSGSPTSSSTAGSPTGSRTAHRSRSAAPTSSTAPRRTARPSTSAAPHPTTSTRTSTAATSPAGTPRTVQLNKGSSCGPHCYSLVVSLSGFPGGTHTIACWSGHGGRFGQYQTSATTSSGCSYSHPHDTVWVVVDGSYRSNTVSW